MHFLNPAVLIGLVAAVLPLAIHLLDRSRTPPVPFSNLEFLRRLHHSRMRRIRLRQWLVLLLRTLIILLLVAAFARPAYRDDGSGIFGQVRPTAAVALFDRSFSMGYQLPEGRIFDLLSARAEELGTVLRPRDRLFLVPFALSSEVAETATDGAALAASLQQLTPSEEATDLGAALDLGSDVLASLAGFNREVYLFTDLGAPGWQDLSDHRQWLPDARIFVITPELSARPQSYISRVEVGSWMAVPGAKLRARFELENSSAEPLVSASVDLYLDGRRVGHRAADLPPGLAITESIPFAPNRAGHLAGYVELEDDRLNLDNRRYFAFEAADTLRVLVLGGTPQDTYYPRRGLAAAATEDLALVIDAGLFSHLTAESLASVDVLLLCNLEHLEREKVELLHRFVADGGGLVIFPGPRADMSFFNRRLLSGLIPVAITGVTGDPGGTTGYQRLRAERSHLLVHQLFPGLPADQPLFRASFELVPRGSLDPLVYFEQGPLAIVSAWKDRGRTVLLAFPLALEWNDLPIRGMFAPLMHRLVRLLGGDRGDANTYLVGQTVKRHLPGVAIEAEVMAESPAGKRFLLEPQQEAGGLFWALPTADRSGIWTVFANGEQVDQFPVNVDTRESDLDPASRDEVQRIFGAPRVHFVETGKELEPEVMAHRHGHELWREFLGLAGLLLVLELWLARAPHRASSPQVSPPHDAPESRSRKVSKV